MSDPATGPGAGPDVATRFRASASTWSDWPLDALLRAKSGRRISVVVPARNEAATVGSIVAGIRTDLVETVPLVDELVVIDSDSTDDTSTVAADAGAQVHESRGIRPDLGTHPGKGEALWKAQFVTTGELLVFVDGDLTGWGTHFVTGLLGPLLTRPQIHLVRGFYDRVLEDGSGRHATQGGRVTELVARPLLNLFRPELAHIVQPLAGEWAITRTMFASLDVPTGYGVEMATLLDVHARHGWDAIAQVDLGARAHTHQSVHDLAVMAGEIMAVAARRGIGPDADAWGSLWQFDRARTPPWHHRAVPVLERPPATTIGAA